MLGKLTKNSLVRNERGFSLVELMVVVAIIGVLAAIAVPNVTRYIAKSRQSEAKTNLGALYSSEQTFFTEFNTYSSSFQAIAFRPVGQLRYNVGFGAGATDIAATLAIYGYTGATAASAVWPNYRTTGFNANPGFCAGTPTQAAITAYNANATCGMMADSRVVTAAAPVNVVVPTPTAALAARFFTAAASSQILSSSVNIDHWTINQNKVVTNPIDGVNQ